MLSIRGLVPLVVCCCMSLIFFSRSSSYRSRLLLAPKKAIVTLLCGGADKSSKYIELVRIFESTLRKTGYDGEILVLYTSEFPISAVSNLSIRTKRVDLIDIPGRTDDYRHLLTKFNIWNLVEYEQVVYYDCDFVFQRNPSSAFDDCGDATLCAATDTGMLQSYTTVPVESYFNAGFLVIRPDSPTFKWLLSRRKEAENLPFCEQDLLNILYKGRWKKLSQTYNLMHVYKQSSVDPSILAIHEKIWILKKEFPGKEYVWNTDLITSKQASSEKKQPSDSQTFSNRDKKKAEDLTEVREKMNRARESQVAAARRWRKKMATRADSEGIGEIKSTDASWGEEGGGGRKIWKSMKSSHHRRVGGEGGGGRDRQRIPNLVYSGQESGSDRLHGNRKVQVEAQSVLAYSGSYPHPVSTVGGKSGFRAFTYFQSSGESF